MDERTWRSWETLNGATYDRQPSEKALWSFFQRSGIEMPQEFKTRTNGQPLGRALSIATYKGGVGKSPITISVAARLVEQNFKVAVVTDDGVFRGITNAGRGPSTGSLVSKIDFYDERDLKVSQTELNKLKKEIRDNVTSLPEEEQHIGKIIYSHLIETLERNNHATENLSDIITRYDFVFLDINVNIELIRRYADLVAVILDSDCYYSIQSGQAFVTALRAIRCRRVAPSYFGLVTNCDVGGVGSELEEFVGDLADLNDETHEELRQAKRAEYLRRERIYQMIRTLDFPILSTEMTASYKVAIEHYNEGREFLEGFCYFHSFADVAPNSHAAGEIRRLAEELINSRL
ncbi:AAA family ATPase [Pseudomonas sp. B21-015]|uniref:AAA family ATPase n=1 Tax=Pseudomonas sp. B21-015 TaxID=2895473 RepID=UPI00215F503C|nr:AAA family ATPase [Pseudomonas sp. B21-015]UVM47683.1 AAA family ATPase [Pseudomonas sp. B21-015]